MRERSARRGRCTPATRRRFRERCQVCGAATCGSSRTTTKRRREPRREVDRDFASLNGSDSTVKNSPAPFVEGWAVKYVSVIPWGCGVTTFRSTLLLAFLLVAANAFAVTTPVILSLSPSDAIAGTSSFTLTVDGANFLAGAQVRVNGSGRATSFVSSSKLTATMFFGDVANAGTLQITVASGGAVSSPVNFVVYPNDPQIGSFDPPSTPAQSTNLTITLNGSNFGSTAIVRVNGANRTTTYVSPTQL